MWLYRIREGVVRGLKSVLVGAATLLFLVEEMLWNGLKAGMQRLGRLPGIRLVEGWIARLPPAGAAFFFVLPASLALPVKLLALRMITSGHFMRGALVIVLAKLAATALFARIYVLTQPALMRVAWFVAVRAALLRWRDWAYAELASHPLWAALHDRLGLWRRQFAAWRHARRGWGRRWRALQRLKRWTQLRTRDS